MSAGSSGSLGSSVEELHRWAVDRAEHGTGAHDLIDEVRRRLPLVGAEDVARTVARVEAHLVGLGPLDALLADDRVTDLVVNGPGPVWIDRGAGLDRSGVEVDRPQLDLLVERVVAPLGRRADPVHPVVDGRLADGSRVHVVVPPLAVDGPYLTIRRFGARPIGLEDVAAPPVADLLRRAVHDRANLVVVGGTGSGKTTLLNALAAAIDPGERIITVEDAAELRLPGEHVVRLETRPASVDGPGAVSARELVRSALRMRPDRLLLGEVRGGEALDLLQAMNTGHDGSLSTLHANGCADALRRLETLVLLAGIGLPLDAVRDHIAAAVDIVVHLVRDVDGLRRVEEVAEVVGDPGAAGRVRTLARGSRVVARPHRRSRRRSSRMAEVAG
ncbi:MAG: CpaF family protein [Actinobacteria bacterium]|nr:CpaF family protein [Actinomycetota bacterium]